MHVGSRQPRRHVVVTQRPTPRSAIRPGSHGRPPPRPRSWGHRVINWRGIISIARRFKTAFPSCMQAPRARKLSLRHCKQTPHAFHPCFQSGPHQLSPRDDGLVRLWPIACQAWSDCNATIGNSLGGDELMAGRFVAAGAVRPSDGCSCYRTPVPTSPCMRLRLGVYR